MVTYVDDKLASAKANTQRRTKNVLYLPNPDAQRGPRVVALRVPLKSTKWNQLPGTPIPGRRQLTENLEFHALQLGHRLRVLSSFDVHYTRTHIQHYAAADVNRFRGGPDKAAQAQHHLLRAGQLVDKVHRGIPEEHTSCCCIPVGSLGILGEHQNR